MPALRRGMAPESALPTLLADVRTRSLAGPIPGVTRVLGIETSCDETAASVVDGGRWSSPRWSGARSTCTPRTAGWSPSSPVGPISSCSPRSWPTRWTDAGSDPTGTGIDAVAVTCGPGLIGSLLVGRGRGQGALAGLGRAAHRGQPPRGPPVRVAARTARPRLATRGPAGLGRAHAAGRGDRAGPLPDARRDHRRRRRRGLRQGGPLPRPRLSRAARPSTGSPRRAIPHAFAFPRSYPGSGYDFSFSGLKTSVVNTVRKHPDARPPTSPPRSAQAVVDVLVTRARPAAADVGRPRPCLAGGVAANSLLRTADRGGVREDGIGAFLPSRALCTDNAAMVAAAGWWRLHHGRREPAQPGRRPQPAAGRRR